jgi:hypothetical protein
MPRNLGLPSAYLEGRIFHWSSAVGVHTKHYRNQAAQCEEMAAQATDDALRADWLRLAGLWLAMASGAPADTPVQRFDAMTDAKGTGQPDSTVSH